MSASQVVASLQGHDLVLASEINEIHADIVVLQQMQSRYGVQCGIASFDIALSHLRQLRAEKEQLLAQVTSQLRSMQDHIASSSALAHHLAVGTPYPIITTTAPMSLLRGHDAANSYYISPARRTPLAASVAHETMVGSPMGAGLVQVHTPSGLVVTTNSAILANSPSRLRFA